MPYLTTVSFIRTAAGIVNPRGTFVHGKKVDFTQAFDKPMPLILLTQFDIEEGENMDLNKLIMGFYDQDKPDSTPLEREAIQGRMETLCNSFINVLRLEPTLDIQSVVKGPDYQVYQSTVSGFGLTFNLYTPRAC